MSLGELIASCGSTVSVIAEKMETDKTQVMAWVCGEVPDAFSMARLADILAIPLESLYAAILRTPKII